MTKTINFVDDNGYYSHKIALFDADGGIRTFKYPSVIGTGQEAQTSLDGTRVDMYCSEGATFVCNGAVQNPISLRAKDYGTSIENRVLVHHGLVKAGVAGKRIRLATALPMRDYYLRTGERNDALIKAQSDNMRQVVHQVLTSNPEPQPIAEITESRVLSEGVAAMIDFLVADDGTEAYSISDLHAPMAVLDFGGSTFDVVAMTPELNILQDNSGTLERGTLDIKASFEVSLAERLRQAGVKIEKAAPWMVEQAFEKGYVRMLVQGSMQNIDVRETLRKAGEPVVSEIKKFANSKLKNMSGYQFILLVGGGALLCKELFADWEEAYGLVVRDEYANARGILKYITFVNPAS